MAAEFAAKVAATLQPPVSASGDSSIVRSSPQGTDVMSSEETQVPQHPPGAPQHLPSDHTTDKHVHQQLVQSTQSLIIEETELLSTSDATTDTNTVASSVELLIEPHATADADMSPVATTHDDEQQTVTTSPSPDESRPDQQTVASKEPDEQVVASHEIVESKEPTSGAAVAESGSEEQCDVASADGLVGTESAVDGGDMTEPPHETTQQLLPDTSTESSSSSVAVESTVLPPGDVSTADEAPWSSAGLLVIRRSSSVVVSNMQS